MQNRYPAWAISNFILLSLFGLLLRYMQVFGLPAGNYQFLLHAHSHFAFSGWMFFSISLLIIHTVFGDSFSSAYKTILLVTQLSAWGMLVSFSVYGYHPVSISFSTLFILTGYRFTYLICTKGILQIRMNEAARILIYGSLLFMCLSSLGPFALAPLAASGFRNTALYQDAIYFYLHFQMNGFMLLAALGLFASAYLNGTRHIKMRRWLLTFVISVIPLFLIFTLWVDPPVWIWILSLAASTLNLLCWIKLCLYYRHERNSFSFLVKIALAAISIKIALQVALCIPIIGTWVFQERNLIIGYVHLLTLGCIMPLIIDQFVKKGFFGASIRVSLLNGFYMVVVALYLSVLFIQPLFSSFNVGIPHFQLCLLVISSLFPFAGILYFIQLRRFTLLVPALPAKPGKCD
ncbi:hypothetical protein GZH53_14580 [Flavihumibacter sp. R14]|nr:hypothetical protein [Flavihumibacter soli]